ncbi:hypothetical protein DPM19_28140 [Actinomadura craniellae]|uniref:DUF3592 domain-containing protein n=2 Tax=Actinomadura craniellae TaxID=2231787 RepID=A0A365GYE1_9ACTN|nr:hypothetical protein DPM19_28140 [Actinomadura craniellae]
MRLLAGVFFVAVGLGQAAAVVYLVVWHIYRPVSLRLRGHTATARIVRVEGSNPDPDTGRIKTFTAYVDYTTRTGQRVSAVPMSELRSGNYRPSVGAKAKVVYPPDDPGKAMRMSWPGTALVCVCVPVGCVSAFAMGAWGVLIWTGGI